MSPAHPLKKDTFSKIIPYLTLKNLPIPFLALKNFRSPFDIHASSFILYLTPVFILLASTVET
jgi:hypothetical protein